MYFTQLYPSIAKGTVAYWVKLQSARSLVTRYQRAKLSSYKNTLPTNIYPYNLCIRSMADKIVAPGEQIRPQIYLDSAVALAERLYGIKVDSATELNGYDDKNYHLKVSQPPNNKFITKLWDHGYVLKIMNSSDSKKLNFVETQGELMLFLGKFVLILSSLNDL